MTLVKQTNRVKTSPFACGNPDVVNAFVGTKPEHWDVVFEADTLLQNNGGPQYPNGVVFADKIGLPFPSGAALSFFVGQPARIRDAGKKALPVVCSTTGQAAILQTIQNDYATHKEDVKPYLMENCEEIKKALASRTRFLKLRFEAAKAYFANLPQFLSLESDPSVLAAILQIQTAYHLDSADGKFIIF